MDATRFSLPDVSPAVETFLLGQIGFERCLELQRRLVREIADRDDGQIALLLCEHPPTITIGRSGSRADVATEAQMVRNRQIDVIWVNRGGGSLVHCPGQLAIYPVVPLRWHGLTVGEYLDRLQAALVETLDDLDVAARTQPGRHGLWGRTGQLAAVGVAVRDGVTYYGAYLNVCPMGLVRLAEVGVDRDASMSCLLAERRSAAKMAKVRATLVGRMAEVLGCDRYHLHTGHPALRGGAPPSR